METNELKKLIDHKIMGFVRKNGKSELLKSFSENAHLFPTYSISTTIDGSSYHFANLKLLQDNGDEKIFLYAGNITIRCNIKNCIIKEQK